VQILMGTRNGADFLPDQLQSFLDQTHADWDLWISDDRSTDATRDIVAGFAARHPAHQVRILDGPGRGSAANFLSLAAHPDLPAEPLAFADQDDVWLPHKLSRALDCLADLSDPAQDRPAVYASRTFLTDAALNGRRPSTLRSGPPEFRNALVQNLLAGNTLVLDACAAQKLRATVPAALAAGVPHHDWWISLAMTGMGAAILNDSEPGLLYRQHGRNAIGAHRGLAGALSRLVTIGRGGWSGWIDCNLAALRACRSLLTPGAREILDAFEALRGAPSGLDRLARLRRIGIHRQDRSGNLLIAALALTGRL